jgi:hypothetical protein
MAITAAVCNSFKSEIIQGVHEASDTYKIALYPDTANLSKATTVYSSSGECPATGNYTQGGISLVGYSVTLDGDTAILDWTTNPSWADATISARGALIYNSSQTNKACVVLDFGGTITSTAGTFTVTLPAPAAATGLFRIT